MRQLKKIVFAIPFLLFACAPAYLKNYEPLKVFLEYEKIDTNKFYILQREKISNIETLRIFNGDVGLSHILSKDETNSLFNLKQWKKLYSDYSKDTINNKYWKNEDFPYYNFTLEDNKLLFSKAYEEKYPNNFVHNEIIYLSEPLYYWNKKYILFTYYKGFLYGGSSTKLIIMKKEKKKWIVIQRIGDYVFN